MREIKFRAWDEQNKIMHLEVEFIRSGIDANDWIIFKSNKQTLQNGEVLDNPYFQQQIKLMQYIGLKDKNGKEIYIGDILQTSNMEDNDFDIWQQSKYGYTVVEWGETLGYTFSKWHIEEDYEAVASVFSFSFIEVIGNIYENPELLKKKQ